MKGITPYEPGAAPGQSTALDRDQSDEQRYGDAGDRGWDGEVGRRPGVHPAASESAWDPGSDSSEVMTTEEACRFLKVSRPTLVEIVKRGDIPCRRVGRAWRFHRGSVIEWLEGNSRVSRSPRKRR